MILLPMVQTPVPPSPTVGQCDTLLQYTEGLIQALTQVRDHLNEASSMPDAGLELIRKQVQSMLDDAVQMKTDLNVIWGEVSKHVSF